MTDMREDWDNWLGSIPDIAVATGVGGYEDCDDVKTVMDFTEFEVTGVVLDIGAGSGRLAQLVPEPQNYHGLDISGVAVQHCQRQGLHVIWIQYPEETLQVWADQSFDRILAVSVLTHMPFELQKRWLQTAWHLLRPGGEILVDIIPTTQEESVPSSHVEVFLTPYEAFEAYAHSLTFRKMRDTSYVYYPRGDYPGSSQWIHHFYRLQK